jgi:hypothetical protein
VSYVAGQSMLADYPQGIAINPAFLGARLPVMAEPYGEFLFAGLEIMYQPAVTPFNAPAGEFLLAYRADPEGTAPDTGLDGVNAVASWAHNVTRSRTCDPTKLHCLLVKGQTPLFVQSTEEQRFSTQGRVVMIAEGNIASTSQLGTLYMRYTVRFQGLDLPQIADPTLRLISRTATSGMRGLALANTFAFTGSVDVATSLASGTNLPQLMLNADAPGTAFTSWYITVEFYCTTTGVTGIARPQIVLTPSQPGQILATNANISYAPPATGGDAWVLASTQGNVNAFNLFAIDTSSQPTGANATGITTFSFRSNGAVLIEFITPSFSAGACILRIAITKVQDDQVARTRAHSNFLTTNQQRNIDFFLAGLGANQELVKQAINGLVASVDNHKVAVDTLDIQYLSAFHQILGTPMPVAHAVQATPMFLPLLAGAASWFLSKFGPSIASSVLGYGVKKLTEYASGKEEEPDKRELRRVRRDRKKEQEENPDL